MNAKTAKLLNRYAAVKGWPSRRVKRGYNMRPKRTHFSDKQEMRELVPPRPTIRVIGEVGYKRVPNPENALWKSKKND